MKRILAFDIGIKNLAWCCADVSGTSFTIQGWANENLITGGTAETDAAAGKCFSCAHKAKFWQAASGRGFCVKHCPPLTPALRDLSGALLQKVPALPVLRALAQRCSPPPEKTDLKTKVSLMAYLEKHYCFPKAPAASVKKVELEGLHDSLRRFVSQNVELFRSCTEILLENQPAFKNPVMKSVQMMLFATLRDLTAPTIPKLRLVHAGRKTAGATKGDEGYAERKGASEARVVQAFVAGHVRGRDMRWFTEQAKKSDLADCLCMVMDASA
jgi:hypothetical protein